VVVLSEDDCSYEPTLTHGAVRPRRCGPRHGWGPWRGQVVRGGLPGQDRGVGALDPRRRDECGGDLAGRGDVGVVLDQHRLGVVVGRTVRPEVALDQQRVVRAVVQRVVGVLAAPHVRRDVVLGIAADGDVARPVVGVDAVAGGAQLVVDEVAGQLLAGGERGAGDAVGVDPAAVREHRHVVVDEVVGEGVAVGVVGLRREVHLVRPAAPADRDPGVGHMVDLVVEEGRALGVADVHGHPALVLDRGVVEVAVLDGVAAGGLDPARLVEVDPAQVQAVPGDVGEHARGDRVVL